MSQRRIDLINKAFDRLDQNKDGLITIHDIQGNFIVLIIGLLISINYF